jgi:hypothetical protein
VFERMIYLKIRKSVCIRGCIKQNCTLGERLLGPN